MHWITIKCNVNISALHITLNCLKKCNVLRCGVYTVNVLTFLTLFWRSWTNNFLRLCSVCNSLAWKKKQINRKFKQHTVKPIACKIHKLLTTLSIVPKFHTVILAPFVENESLFYCQWPPCAIFWNEHWYPNKVKRQNCRKSLQQPLLCKIVKKQTLQSFKVQTNPSNLLSYIQTPSNLLKYILTPPTF